MNNNDTIILASASPRRRELLDQIGVKYIVEIVDLDESITDGESAVEYVKRIALAKARAGFQNTGKQSITLGADTCIEHEGEILLKPLDKEDAARILKRISGSSHMVHTAVAAVGTAVEEVSLNSSRVTMTKLEQSTIDAYIATGEPLDKAGAYAIQGVAAQFVTRLDGSYSSVMGLPLFETTQLLQKMGLKTI